MRLERSDFAGLREDSHFLAELARAVGDGALLRDPADLLTYESDALVHLRATPGAVVLPSTASQIQAVVRLCHREGIPFVARGHGTGLSGGALPAAGGVLIGLSKLNRVLDIDIPNLRVTVEPGVTNLEITRRVSPDGCYYAPDPSSQIVCSIGGNIAENSGGAHCLKYGFTVHHVLGVEAVLPDGELIHVGGSVLDAPGLDLLGVLVGSEGTLAVVTKATLRLLRRPESVQTLLAGFTSIDEAGEAVSAIIGCGIVPAAVEMMDRLTIEAAEAAVHPGFPPANAVLIVELDGPKVEVDELFSIVESVCQRAGATTIEIARDQAARERIWKGRKAAFAAMGRVSPNYTCRTVSCRDEAVGGVAPDSRARTPIGPQDRQRLPRGRREPASAHLLRRVDSRSSPARRERRVRDPHVLHRGRWRDYRRTWRRRRQEGVHAEDVFGGRPRRYAARTMRVRSLRDLQSGQGLSNPPSLRRGAGPLPPASSRTRRRRRALLMPPYDIDGAARTARNLWGAEGTQLAGKADAVERSHQPTVVLAPGDAATAASMLQWADAERLTVIPRGAGTKLALGIAPSSADLVLSTARLIAGVDHWRRRSDGDPAAGASLAQINEVLGRSVSGCRSTRRCPIGDDRGIVRPTTADRAAIDTAPPATSSSASDGARRCRTAKAGGRVVKNVGLRFVAAALRLVRDAGVHHQRDLQLAPLPAPAQGRCDGRECAGLGRWHLPSRPLS